MAEETDVAKRRDELIRTVGCEFARVVVRKPVAQFLTDLNFAFTGCPPAALALALDFGGGGPLHVQLHVPELILGYNAARAVYFGVTVRHFPFRLAALTFPLG